MTDAHTTKVELTAAGFVVACSDCGRMYEGDGHEGAWYARAKAQQFALTHSIRMEYAQRPV